MPDTWQVALLVRASMTAAVVLYACSWVSFDAAIARYNLGHDIRPDLYHLRALGEAAKPVIAAHDS